MNKNTSYLFVLLLPVLVPVNLSADQTVTESVLVMPDRRNASCETPQMRDVLESIPGNETEFVLCIDTVGNKFAELRIDGQVYGYQVDTDGKPPMEYTIVDIFGDGKHFNKFDFGDNIQTPDWIKLD